MTINGAASFVSDEELAERFAQVYRLRFDLFDSCNADCVFCGTPFPKQPKLLNLPEFLRVLRFTLANNLRFLDMGCGYEPLLGPNFEEVSRAIRDVSPNLELMTLVTNAQLMHKKDMDPLVDAGLGVLHASVHHHVQSVYERTMRRGDVEQTAENLRTFRRRYPHVTLKLVAVITELNKEDLPGFVEWGMDHIGADEVVLRRAFFEAKPSELSPMGRYMAEAGGAPDVPDGEWDLLAQEIESLGSRYRVQIASSRIRGGRRGIPVVRVSKHARKRLLPLFR